MKGGGGGSKRPRELFLAKFIGCHHVRFLRMVRWVVGKEGLAHVYFEKVPHVIPV